MTIHTRKKKRARAERINLFVYGTLKHGFPLHGWLENSKYLGPDIVEGFTLLSLGAYPAMLSVLKPDGHPATGYKVEGELWSVPMEDFEAIRRMEERVGYTTMLIPTQSNAGVAAFVLGQIQRGTVEWSARDTGLPSAGQDTGRGIYEVRTVVPESNNDYIPF